MPGIKLKLDGKPWDLRALTPKQQELKRLLSAAPADELYTTQSLMTTTKSAKCSLSAVATLEDFAQHTRLVGQKRYWGSAAAIKELDRQLGAKS